MWVATLPEPCRRVPEPRPHVAQPASDRRDGIQVDQQITQRRMAAEELKTLPPPEDDASHLPASIAQAAQPPQTPASH